MLATYAESQQTVVNDDVELIISMFKITLSFDSAPDCQGYLSHLDINNSIDVTIASKNFFHPAGFDFLYSHVISLLSSVFTVKSSQTFHFYFIIFHSYIQYIFLFVQICVKD